MDSVDQLQGRSPFDQGATNTTPNHATFNPTPATSFDNVPTNSNLASRTPNTSSPFSQPIYGI